MKITKYSDIYKTDSVTILSTIKMKIVNEFIQIIRPVNWSKEKVGNLVAYLKKVETFNARREGEIVRVEKRWQGIKIGR